MQIGVWVDTRGFKTLQLGERFNDNLQNILQSLTEQWKKKDLKSFASFFVMLGFAEDA